MRDAFMQHPGIKCLYFLHPLSHLPAGNQMTLQMENIFGKGGEWFKKERIVNSEFPLREQGEWQTAVTGMAGMIRGN